MRLMKLQTPFPLFGWSYLPA